MKLRSTYWFLDKPLSWLYTWWFYGKRCDVYVNGSPCCEAWALHDETLALAKILREQCDK